MTSNRQRSKPQILYSIEKQRQRMIWHGVAFGLCWVVVALGWYFSGLLRILAVGFFLVSPFMALGFFASRKLKKEHQARLEDCERRISVGQ